MKYTLKNDERYMFIQCTYNQNLEFIHGSNSLLDILTWVATFFIKFVSWSSCRNNICSCILHVLPWNGFGLVWFMVFNATFNNISVILWRSILMVEETGVSGENHRPVTRHWQTLSHNVVLSTPRHEWALKWKRLLLSNAKNYLWSTKLHLWFKGWHTWKL